MDHADAVALIAPAVTAPGGRWADLGAGSGPFTRALAELLGPAGELLAVEREGADVVALRRLARERGATLALSVLHADFTAPTTLAHLVSRPFDGVLLANALHFVPAADQSRVVRALARTLVPSGRLVLVEYEGRRPNRWVPAPVSFARFGELAADAGLTAPAQVGTRPSAYGGEMYAAYATKPD